MMKSLWAWLKDCWKHWYVKLAVAIAVIFLFVFISNWIENIWAFWDNDKDRGAVSLSEGQFGPGVTDVVYLDTPYTDDETGQGWSRRQSLWFGNITQGSDLLPYDFFLVLRRQGSKELIRSDANMNLRYRYLPRKATSNNSDALPIGMVKDTFRRKAFMGFTCAACHTGQINYKGTGIRIDGAPSMADMNLLLDDIAKALSDANVDNSPAQTQFIKDVLALGNYSSADEVKADLRKYAIRLTVYRIVNYSATKYGYARLDAFGRIYNQVLQYVLTVPDVQEALDQLKADGTVTQKQLDAAGVTAVMQSLSDRKTELDGDDRDRLFATLQSSPSAGVAVKDALNIRQVLHFRDKIFNSPDAPVSYPFLWDIPQHDYVQWNGIGANSGLGPIGRNTGEVIGVFGSMDWARGDHWTLAALITGQGFTSHPIDFKSSVNLHNLALIEDQLKSLHSPVWPAKIFGPINDKIDPGHPERPLWQRGQQVFERYCSECHANIDRDDVTRRIVAHMSAVDHVGTDPRMAVNSVKFEGYSGIVRDQYATIGAGPVLLNKRAKVAALLTQTTTGVVATPDADKWFGQSFAEWIYDMIFSLHSNNIKSSLKNGDYRPDTSAEPVASLVAYKGRALDGIWATAPYLHNGSVPNLYDLLLPGCPMPGDPPGMTYRPTKFQVGSREFDPKYVGFRSDGYAGFLFQTSIPGNSNCGHDYGTRDVKDKDGNLLRALTEQQRWDLVEYLKSL